MFVEVRQRLPVAPVRDAPLVRLLDGFAYTGIGPEFALAFSLAGVMVFTAGHWSRRVRAVCLWSGLALLAAAASIGPRLVAEAYLARAERLEAAGDDAQARASLEQALAWAPHLGPTTSTLRQRGRLDVRAGKTSTPAARFFLADQWAQAQAWDEALPRLEALHHEEPDNRAVRLRLAQAHADCGLTCWRERRQGDAVLHWTQAHEIHATQKHTLFYTGLAQADLARLDPAPALTSFETLAAWAGDRVLLADLEASRGDALFQAGRHVEARDAYMRSLKILNLPKVRNIRAERGLIGQ